MKALERVLEKAKEVFSAATNASGSAATWEALAALRRAIEEADRTPPPHLTTRD